MEEIRENTTFFSVDDLNTTSSNPYYITNNLDSVFSANRLFYISELVDHYYTPLLCFFGAIGNFLSIAVFCFNANQRSLSSSYYLSALAISDTGFLLTVFIFWLESTFGSGPLLSEFGCPIIMYSGQVTCFLSVWLTVAFTVERFFAVCSPLKRSSICTVSKARKVIASLTTFALIAFSYALLIARVVEDGTTNVSRMEDVDGHLGKLNPGDNDTFTPTPNSEMGQMNEDLESFTFTIPLESNQLEFRKDSDDSAPFLAFELNGTRITSGRSSSGCHYLNAEEGCQLEFINSVKGDVKVKGDSFNKDGITAVGESGNIITTATHDSGGPFPAISFHTTSTIMFNSTSLINLNNSDSYEGRNGSSKETEQVNGGAAQSPELRCTVPMEYIPISIYANYIDSAITLIIPFFLITYFNMRIAICVWKLKDERKRMVAGNGNQLYKFNQRAVSSRQNQQQASGRSTKVSAPAADKEEELIPMNQIQGENGKRICKMCGALEGGENPFECVEQIPTLHESSPNTKGHLSQQNEISCTACKFVLNQPTKEKEVSSSRPILPVNNDNSTRAGGENFPNHCSSPSTTTTTKTKLGMQMKLSPTLDPKDLNHHGETQGQSSDCPKARSKLHEIGMAMSRRGRFCNLRTTATLTTTTSSGSSSSETRVTKMLLLVSTAFLLLNFPSHAIRLLVFIQSMFWGDDIEVMRSLFAAQQLSNVLLFNTNFAVNFLLYCLSGRNFRKSLWNVLFGSGCHKKSRRSYANSNAAGLQKMVRILPKSPVVERNEDNIPARSRELVEQGPVFPKSINKIRIDNDFESIELETTMA